MTLAVQAPGPVPPSAPEEALRLLTDGEAPGRWLRVQAERNRAGSGVELRLALHAADSAAAVTAVVDDVRALVGMHAMFTRWLVDIRHVQVVELPP